MSTMFLLTSMRTFLKWQWVSWLNLLSAHCVKNSSFLGITFQFLWLDFQILQQFFYKDPGSRAVVTDKTCHRWIVRGWSMHQVQALEILKPRSWKNDQDTNSDSSGFFQILFESGLFFKLIFLVWRFSLLLVFPIEISETAWIPSFDYTVARTFVIIWLYDRQWMIAVSVCLSVCLFLSVSLFPSACLSVSFSVCLSICLSLSLSLSFSLSFLS